MLLKFLRHIRHLNTSILWIFFCEDFSFEILKKRLSSWFIEHVEAGPC